MNGSLSQITQRQPQCQQQGQQQQPPGEKPTEAICRKTTHTHTETDTQRQRNIRIKLWTPSPSRTACTDNEAAWRGQIKSTRRWECNNKRAECAHWSLHPCLVIVCARSLSLSRSRAHRRQQQQEDKRKRSAQTGLTCLRCEREREREGAHDTDIVRERQSERARELAQCVVSRVSAQFPLRTLGAAALLLSIIQTVNVVE